ncbi:FHA domain-containing serine/threonine-protein kinase [Leptolyngbya sp. NIES-2104]|uniref:FHA domain-containing serine/threonine-protein kinase n=1 Tax=Leptolyngbya sp. NIES-2104 TaxID=1552121 RepID=UPI0006EC8AE8|nr:FHA domain-containing serine/threonine-protein kinase [Leptolyngbya sp. NIES-2104]GAP94032.1 serine/threonine protein kinase [Leptolyngbya sp. NIES-2104]
MHDRVLQNYRGGIIPIQIPGVADVELLDLLGVGGFGTVWKVRDPATGKLYVLKIIQAIKPNTVLVERVRLEAEVSIPSKHIVPVIGLREWDSSTFLILFELFEARSLDKVLAEDTLKPEQKRRIFDQILIGVADAHRSNIIHRDLKPENILVGKDHYVKLIDFGLSKFKGKGLTMTGEVMGTPPYMSPELLIYGSKIADARVDIYALGHILYELAMGYTFWAKQGWVANRFENFVKFLGQFPQPVECIELSDFHCDFYHNAAAVLARMVKTNADDRFASVEDVIRVLAAEPSRKTVPPIPEVKETGGISFNYPLLTVESGTNRNARTLVTLEPGESIVLGRADIAGNDLSISSKHLIFTRQHGRYFVNDFQSKNGTLLRGMLLNPNAPPLEVQNDDRIKVGEIFLRFNSPA